MKISTRGRYALRAFVDMAEHGGGFIPLKEIAARQEISLKYLEPIMRAATRSGLAEAQHGKGGGYKLARPPQSISVKDVLLVTEGDLAPVECLGKGAKPCPRAADCRTLGMWKEFARTADTYFGGISVADLMGGAGAYDYQI